MVRTLLICALRFRYLRSGTGRDRAAGTIPRSLSSGGRANAVRIWRLPFCKRRDLRPITPRKPAKGCALRLERHFRVQFSAAVVRAKIVRCSFSCRPHCIEVRALCQSKEPLTQCVQLKYNVCMQRITNRLKQRLMESNRKLAKELWREEIGRRQVRALQDLTERFGFSVAQGEIQLLNGNWYVTHSGLLRLAYRNRCSGIRVQAVREYCNSADNRWVFKATVYMAPGSNGFVGYGDADPSNVSSLVRGAEMRVAETRAVNRALRKAYGIGLCSVEELGSPSAAPTASMVRPCRIGFMPQVLQPTAIILVCGINSAF